ncbi:hypothetical protein GCM10009759_63570 [Kitasatospora saccharophila]|uniref:SUKH-4 immunity protein of toxin-antitoxin system n=1 Tax=Kitasatospora saccharophila TaxID=407973 RepID=A0ABP5JLV5_9ACTN
MAEQYFSAFAVDAAALLRLPGSGDRALPGVPPSAALAELLSGRLRPDQDSRYTALLPALAGAFGTPLGAVSVPGRHWDELTEVFTALELPALTALWSRPWPFPAGATDDWPWPYPTLAARADTGDLLVELAALASESVHEQGVEALDEDDLEEASWFLTEHLPVWTSRAHALDLDLLLVRDGAR